MGDNAADSILHTMFSPVTLLLAIQVSGKIISETGAPNGRIKVAYTMDVVTNKNPGAGSPQQTSYNAGACTSPHPQHPASILPASLVVDAWSCESRGLSLTDFNALVFQVIWAA